MNQHEINNAKLLVEDTFLIIFLKKYAYSIAVFLFISGITFRNKECMTSVLNLFSYLTGIPLNYEFRLIGFEMMGSGFLLIGFLLVLYKLACSEKTIFTKNQFFVTALIAIIVFFWITIFENMVNVPITDDYFTVLNFLNSYIHISDLNEQWSRIYAPYVETRNVITKLIVIGSWKLTGGVNFKWFIIIINLALTGIGFLVYKVAHKERTENHLTIPLFFLIFQFSYYDAEVWTTAGIHIVLTMFFVFTTFFLLERNTTHAFIIAIVMAILASFTYGNGLLAFPVGLVILLVGKQKLKILLWSLPFLLILFFYFHNYKPVRTVSDFLSFKPQLLISYCLLFYGSALQFMYRLELPAIAGATFFLIFSWLTQKKYYLLNPLNYSMMLYIILSGMIAALFRFDNQQGVQQALSNRYVIYSCLAGCFVIISLAEILNEGFDKRIRVWAYIFSISYFIMSAFFFYPEVVIRKNKLIVFSESIKNDLPLNYIPIIIPEGADTIIKRARENGIYKP